MDISAQSEKRIGILAAIELDAVYKLYPNPEELECPPGFKVLRVKKGNCTLYILRSGMGVIAAAAGVQYLITKYNIEMLVNFGVAGGLTPAMGKQKICLVNRVVHYKYDCSEFMDLVPGQVDGHDSVYLLPSPALLQTALELSENTLPLVTCCSGDKFVGTAVEKTHLHNTFDGDICDMESAGIVLACEANGVPCILFKAISDGLSDGASGFYNELTLASLRCLKIADKMTEMIL